MTPETIRAEIIPASVALMMSQQGQENLIQKINKRIKDYASVGSRNTTIWTNLIGEERDLPIVKEIIDELSKLGYEGTFSWSVPNKEYKIEIYW